MLFGRDCNGNDMKEGYYSFLSGGDLYQRGDLCYVNSNGYIDIPGLNPAMWTERLRLGGPNPRSLKIEMRVDPKTLRPVDPKKHIENRKKEIKNLEAFLKQITKHRT